MFIHTPIAEVSYKACVYKKSKKTYYIKDTAYIIYKLNAYYIVFTPTYKRLRVDIIESIRVSRYSLNILVIYYKG